MDAIKSNDSGLRELALFAGGGGGILGGLLLGWRTVCAVEVDEYARSILVRRQNDGHLAPFPIWDDVCTFDGRPWRGCVDVVSGGFPCQDISAAGKGAGIDGAQSSLWREMARIVGQVRPRYVWVENSPLLVSRGLGLVLSDLASMGYHARWGIVGADDAGAPHRRKRIWILAYADSLRKSQQERQQQKERGRISNSSLEYSDVHGQPSSTKRRSSEEKLQEKQTRQNKAQHSTRTGSISTTNENVEDTDSRAIRHKDRKSRANRRRDAGRKLHAFRQKYRQKSANRTHTTSAGRRTSKTLPNSESKRLQRLNRRQTTTNENVADSNGERQPRSRSVVRPINSKAYPKGKTNLALEFSGREKRWWDSEPAVGRVAYGVADRVDRLKCLGNGQVPAVVALAWNALSKLE